jgi:hypothetical protein
MGILDDAIREHLELKRQHGAEESEVESLEAEAFGPADRPDAVDPPPAPSEFSEDETRVISPGSSITTPAGEGDQLDKVFEATREEQVAESSETAVIEQPIVPIPPAPSPKADPETAAEPEATATETVETEPADDLSADDLHEGDDAGDALERERQALAGQPTEHYDVDAAIAEEDEIDILSESSLSDELDRALDGPLDEATPGEDAPAPPVEQPEPDFGDEPVSEEIELEDEQLDSGPEEDDEVSEGAGDDGEPEGDADFFDQDDPLEGTPDFLEETPEHDRLWFEQKQPKDFDFGD